MAEADIVLYSNAIFTGTSDETISGGIALLGNIIIKVGERNEIKPFISEKTTVRELGDALITPGFCDAHAHFMEGATMSSEHFCNTLDRAKSEEECVQMMKDFSMKYPKLPRYFGYGWLPSYWGENAAMPTKKSLDVLFPDKPVYLRAVDGHSEWMNSKALEESGYTQNMKPEYGFVDKLENGELSGLVREKADVLARRNDTKLPAEEMEMLQERLMMQMNRKGLTSCTEMSAILPEEIDQEYQYVRKMEKEGKLSLRIFLYPGTDVREDRIAEIDPFREKYSSDMLKISGLKGFADGVTSTYTAALMEPYLDKPETSGTLNYPAAQFQKWTAEANRKGYGVRVHCIGDYAVHMMLDACEQSNQRNDNAQIRNSIEHIEVIDPQDIPRFQKLGVIPSMQPLHLPLDRFDKRYRVGRERSMYEWAMKSILRTGAILAAGTDYPVADYDPIPNIYMAVTRKGMDGIQYGTESLTEKLSVSEILKAYTYGGAYVNHMENCLGTLEEGKYADITAIDKDLLHIDPEEILNADVVMTIVNGTIVYEA